MAQVIRLKHPQSGLITNGFYGFSFTSFFFSGIPAIMRGDLGIGLGIVALTVIGGAFFLIPAIIVNLVWAVTYNKNYTRRLLEKGYVIDDSAPNAVAAKAALGVA